MKTINGWRFICLLLFLGIGSALYGQERKFYSVDSPPPDHQSPTEEVDSRSMACTGNAIDNGNFQDFSSLSGQSCTNAAGTCTVNLTSGCSSNRAPFQTCNSSSVGDWWVSHGTPEVFRTGNSLSAMMWSGRFNAPKGDNTIYGEGLFTYCFEFKEGNTYNLSFSIRKQGLALSNFFVKLASNLNGPNDYNNPSFFTVNEYYEIPTAAAEQTLYTNPGFNSSSFVTVNLTFTANADYNYLWFYPYQNSTSGDLSYLYMDNVCVSCIAQVDEVIYTNSSTLPGYTYANDLINAKQNATVYNGNNITFRSGEEILLESDFTVQSGGDFTAFISPLAACNLACATGNTFTDNGDNSAAFSQDSSPNNRPGTPKNRIEVFPNPSTGKFHISFPNTDEQASFQYIVTNALGKVLLQRTSADTGETIDLLGHPPGIYFLQIQIADTKVTKRLLLQ